MQSGEASRTALAAARHRAAHQLLEYGSIFTDPLAVRILGEDAETIARQAAESPSGRMMRIFIAVRTRFAEDALAAAVERGVRQLVVLGAGLDTYAFRGAMRERLRVFEVDHPATQAWKRRRLDEAGIALPECLTFAPVDFERETLAGGLHDAGFDPAQQTFFTWLGVVPYLTEEAVWSTLGFIASLPNGAHVVFDYSEPPDSLSPEMRELHDRRAARVAELGEPWVNYFESDQLRARLMELGFSSVEDLGPAEIAARYFPTRAASTRAHGGHILRADTIGNADGKDRQRHSLSL
jgi:methyltransferase (TIGR00027 family)